MSYMVARIAEMKVRDLLAHISTMNGFLKEALKQRHRHEQVTSI